MKKEVLKVCSNCEEGHLHKGVRDIAIKSQKLSATVKKIAGAFCDHCDEIEFNDTRRSIVMRTVFGKEGKSVARIKALDSSLMVKQGHEDSTLWWNLRRLYFYLENNAGTLVNYGAP